MREPVHAGALFDPPLVIPAPMPPFNLLAPDLWRDPHPVLDHMRREDPVHWSPQLQSWILTSYADIHAAFFDQRLSVVEETKRIDELPQTHRDVLLPLRKSFDLWVGRSTSEAHDRFTKILRRGFTPATVANMVPQIQKLADALINARRAQKTLDVVNDIAHPMAMTVVTDLVLEMPGLDVQLLVERSNDISGLLEMGELSQLVRCQNAILELSAMIEEKLTHHRREGRKGVIETFLEAQDAGQMSHEEIVSNCIMFLVVGYHTTANHLCNGLQLLFEHPEQRRRLEAQPQLLGSAIDEMMRYHGPVASVRRLAIEDFELRGKPIRKGDTLLLAVTAGNRDPAVYANPHAFDIGRTPNKHLGFTMGPYSCMGKALARIESETFYSRMLALEGLRPLDATPDWQAFRPLGHELRTMRVAFH